MSQDSRSTWHVLGQPLSRPSRRGLLRGGVGAAALLAALGEVSAQSAQAELSSYKRTFFSDAEWAFIVAVCARLIPSDGDGPGAIETHVPIFIDRQMSGDFGTGVNWFMEGPHNPAADPLLGFQSPLTPANIYHQGIAAVDAWCKQQHGKVFAALTPQMQDEVLTATSANKIGIEPAARDFFSLLLQNTKEGYFSDPQYGGNFKMAAWSYIGFPGARASFREWAERGNTRYPLGSVAISGERV